MNIKSALEYKLKWWATSIGTFYAVMILAAVVASIALGIAVDNGAVATSFATETTSNFMSISFVMAFIMLTSIKGDMNLFLQNGLSRKTSFVVTITAICVMSAMVIVVETVLGLVGLHLLDQNPVGLFLSSGDMSLALIFVTNIHITLGGYVVGAAYYRLTKIQNFVVFLAVPAVLALTAAVFIPMITPDNPILDAVATVIAVVYMQGNGLWFSVLCISGLCALTALLSWLILRKAPLKQNLGT